MSLTSTIVHALEQPDGSKLVQEQHTDQAGKAYSRFYTAAPGTDLQAAATTYATVLQNILADSEVDEVIQ